MFKKIIIFIILVLIVVLGIVFFLSFFNQNKLVSCTMEAKLCPDGSAVGRTGPNCEFAPCPQTINSQSQDQKIIISPISRALERITKKPFGIYITPQNSPVQPEKFKGYHTGVDFETFPEEQNAAVPILAVCSGKLMVKEFISGYGGVAVESCNLNGQAVTVIYGHLKLASITTAAGQDLSAGQTIGILGQGYSQETDKERQHLHLGIHQGQAIDWRGYVQDQTELEGWLDAAEYL